MAVLTNFPDIRPSLLLDFANSRRLDPRVSLVRATTGTIINAAGQLEVVPANSPRIDFDPVTGRCPGLLVEESRTNLLTYSGDFTNAAWVKGRLSIGAPYGQTYGALTGAKLVEDSGGVTGTHSLSRTVSAAAGTTVTQYWIVAAGERSSVALRCAAPAVVGRAFFDLAAGVYRTDNANVTAGMRRMMGSLWLIWATYAISSGGSSGTCQIELATTYASGGIDYIGDGVSGVYVFGAQFEVGAFPTSYIPTTTAQVTRAADLPTMYGAPIGQSAGTFLAAASSFGANNTDRRLVTASSGSLTNLASLYFAVSGVSASIVQSGGVFQYGAVESAVIPGQSYQKALAYEAGNMRAATAGVLAAASSVSVLVPAAAIDRLDIGHRLGNQILNGHIARIAYYSTRLPDAQLQRLTA